MTDALSFAPELLSISGVSPFECFVVAQVTRWQDYLLISVGIDQALDVDLTALSSHFAINLVV